jgi:DNA repair protein RecO (recombination protein O)
VTVGLLSRPLLVCDAVVLRRWACGETSVIASLLTDDHGFVKIIAKAARQARSALRPVVQPGRLVQVEIAVAPGRDLQYLRGGNVKLDPLRDADLERYAYLLAAMELTDRCRAAGSDAPALFALCADFLRVLSCASAAEAAMHFYAFELALLARLGMAPQLLRCTRCGGEALPTGSLWFSPAAGGVVCGRCHQRRAARGARPLSAAVRSTLANLASGAVTAVPERALRREVGILLHRFLAYHLPAYRLPASLGLLRPPIKAEAAELGDAGEQE